jgi:thioredoxin-like negative regulator of GroEL
LIDFALSKLTQQHVIKLTDENSLDSFLSRDRERPHVILFTSKPTTPPLFKSLATRFKNQIVFGEISDKQTRLTQRFEVKKFPTVLAIISGENNEAKTTITYDGEIGPEPLIEWLTSLLPSSPHQKEVESDEEKQKEKVQSGEETKSTTEKERTRPSTSYRSHKEIIELTESNLDT